MEGGLGVGAQPPAHGAGAAHGAAAAEAVEAGLRVEKTVAGGEVIGTTGKGPDAQSAFHMAAFHGTERPCDA